MVCAGVDRGSSRTPGSVCACLWDAQRTNLGQDHAQVFLGNHTLLSMQPIAAAPRTVSFASSVGPAAEAPPPGERLGNTQPSSRAGTSETIPAQPHGRGCQPAALGRGEGLGLLAGFPLQVAVQPGGVHPLRLLRGLVWAVQPHQPDGAQHGLLPEGLLPSIW